MNRAVFLDRDGTILEEVHYLTKIDDLVFIPQAAKAVREINQLGFKAIVITNQSAVGRGMLDIKDLENIHKVMMGKLKKQGARVDDIFYCPHHPEEQCGCRKPKPGLVLQAAKKHLLDIKTSFMIGDNIIDMELSKAVGCHGILVRTGYGKSTEENYKIPKEWIADNIGKAVSLIRNFVDSPQRN